MRSSKVTETKIGKKLPVKCSKCELSLKIRVKGYIVHFLLHLDPNDGHFTFLGWQKKWPKILGA